MRSAKYRHRISIQRKTTTTNDLGQKVNEWSEWKSVRAAVYDLSGRELERARQRFAEASVRVEIRYLPEITTQDRIVFGSRTLHIGAALDEENRKREHVLICSEVR